MTLPTRQLSLALRERLNGLHSHLEVKIKGQHHVFDRVCSILTRGELGLTNPHRPKGSCLFVGPTGVGKTEMTNAFTAYLFDRVKPIVFDMSEYQLQQSVEKWIGENRNDPGLLGHALRGVTRGTLLLDEIEKAHPQVLDLLLQILEVGRITLATGEVLDLCGFYIVGTSNIGSCETIHMESALFASVERTVLMRVREQVRPELIGRINEIVVFSRLDFPTQRAICEAMIAAELSRLSMLGYWLEVSPGVEEFLARKGYHRLFGVRPMRRTVESSLQDALAFDLLSGGSGSGKLVVNSTANCLAILKA